MVCQDCQDHLTVPGMKMYHGTGYIVLIATQLINILLLWSASSTPGLQHKWWIYTLTCIMLFGKNFFGQRIQDQTDCMRSVVMVTGYKSIQQLEHGIRASDIDEVVRGEREREKKEGRNRCHCDPWWLLIKIGLTGYLIERWLSFSITLLFWSDTCI